MKHQPVLRGVSKLLSIFLFVSLGFSSLAPGNVSQAYAQASTNHSPQLAGGTFYANEHQLYTVTYPDGWSLYDTGVGGKYSNAGGTLLSSLPLAANPDGTYPVEVSQGSILLIAFESNTFDAAHESLNAYVDTYLATPDFMPPSGNVTISGIQFAELHGDLGRLLYISNGPNVYSLYTPANNAAENESTIESIIGTLRFTGNKPVSTPAGEAPNAGPFFFQPSHGSDLAAQALPAMKMPWQSTETHTYNSGPHGAGDTAYYLCRSYPTATSLSGIDFNLNHNNEVLAVAEGTILYYYQGTDPRGGVGNEVIVDHGGGFITRYWHLYAVSDWAKKNVGKVGAVQQGQVLGWAGKSGNQGSEHLHLELRSYSSSSQLWSGIAYGWNGVVIDGYRVRSILDANATSKGLNYQDTLTKGSESITGAYAYPCTSSYHRQGRKYTGSGGTIEAGSGGAVYSTNIRKDGPPPCPQIGGVVLYWQQNFKCDNSYSDPGYRQYLSSALDSYPGKFNDKTQSVRVTSGWSVALYSELNRDPYHIGRRVCLNTSVANFWATTYWPIMLYGISSIWVFNSPNCGGLSNYSIPGDAQPLSMITNTGVPPNMPENLSVTAVTADSLTLGWDDMSSNESGFNVYKWGYDGADWAFLYYDSVAADQNTYTDTGLNCGDDFNYYMVTSYNGDGESEAAGWVQGTTATCLALTNDDFDQATAIGGSPYNAELNVSGATWTNDDPNIDACNLVAPDSSIWYSFTPVTDGQLYLDTVGSNFDTVLAVWTGTRGSLAPVGCNDDNSYSTQSELSLPLSSGTTYYLEAGKFYDFIAASMGNNDGKVIAAGRDLGKLSTDVLDFKLEFVGVPSNDEISSAKTISSVPYTDTSNTTGATWAADDPALTACGLDSGNASVWYQYVAAQDGILSIDTVGSDFDTILAVWTGTPGGLTPVGCDDDSGGNVQSALDAPVVSGTTYYIEAAEFWNYLPGGLSTQSTKPSAGGPVSALSGGTLKVNAQLVQRPDNDEAAGATEIDGVPYTDTMSTVQATANVDDLSVPNCSVLAGLNTVWYQYTPSEDVDLYIDTLGSNYDTYLAIWDASSGLAPVACNDDANFLGGVLQSAVAVHLNAGTPYHVEVGEWNGYDVSSTSIGLTRKSAQLRAQAGGSLQFHVDVSHADTQVSINGTDVGNYDVPGSSSERYSYGSTNNGPAEVSSSNHRPIVASERVAYTPDGGTTWTSYAELMGLPSGQLTDTYVFPWYNSANLSSQVSVGNVGTDPTTITVKIGGVVRDTYSLDPSASKRVKYFGLNTGPVVVQSSDGVPIIASERISYTPDGTHYTSYSELMGLPASQLASTYLFPWYNSNNLSEQVSVANVGDTTTTVTVTIGGVVRDTYDLAPSASRRVKYPGLNTGPVVVQSSDETPIISSERISFTPDGGVTYTGYSEMMGMPAGLLSDTYTFPWYNSVNHSMQVSVANVGSDPTTVTVSIAGNVVDSYSLDPSASRRVKYTGYSEGPVVVKSSGWVPIIASERTSYTPDGGATYPSFSEMLGLPDWLMTDTYLFPWYNNVNLNTEVRFGVP